MSLKKTKTMIDLKDMGIRNYSAEEKKDFAKVREGYAAVVRPMFERLRDDPSILSVSGIDAAKLLALVEEAEGFKEAEEWLAEKLEQVQESRQARMSEVKKGADKLLRAAKAKLAAEENEPVSELISALLDFTAQPRKKAVQTLRKKKASS